MKRISALIAMVALTCTCAMGSVAFADDATSGGIAAGSMSSDAAITVQSDEGTQTISVNPSGSAAEQTEALRAALETNNKEGAGQLVVTLGKNKSYKISGKLRIYSNTTFDLNGSTITRDGVGQSGVGVNDGMLVNYPIGWKGTTGVQRESKANGGYNMSTNITVKNGTLDGGKVKKATEGRDLMRFDHASNITVQDISFENVYNCHHLELIGVKDGTISNCTFEGFEYKDHKKAFDNGLEALELDAAWTDNPGSVGSNPVKWKADGRWASDTYLDGTHDENIVVEGCTFINLPTTVGEHHYSTDSRCTNSTGIIIRNNTINATASLPYKPGMTIGGLDNVQVTGNKISGPYAFLIQTYAGENIEISGNTLTGGQKGKNAIMIDHDSHGVKVDNNTINNAGSHAISVGNVAIGTVTVSSITGNTINKTRSSGNGINVNFGSVASIANNKIFGTAQHAISIPGGTVTDITGNKVTKPLRNGINVGKDAKTGKPVVTNITNNTMKNCFVHGISMVYGKVTNITGNTINKTGNKGSGIAVTKGSISLIGNNAITNAGKNGITVVGGSVGKKGKAKTGILNNKIKTTRLGMGITISGKGAAANINGNTITKTAKNGIAFTGKVKVYQVNSNKITIKAPKYFGIWAGGKSVKTKIQKNTINAPAKKYGIGHAVGAKYKASKNTIKYKAAKKSKSKKK